MQTLFLNLTHSSHYHEAVLKGKYSQAYLIACSITESAQELEDWTSTKSVH